MVVGRVAQEPSEEIGPSEVVNRMHLALDSSVDDLGVEMVVEDVGEGRLDGEGLVQKSLPEALLRSMHHHHRYPHRVELRPSCPPHHRKDIGDGKVDIALGRSVIELRALDDDQMCREVDAPC